MLLIFTYYSVKATFIKLRAIVSASISFLWNFINVIFKDTKVQAVRLYYGNY